MLPLANGATRQHRGSSVGVGYVRLASNNQHRVIPLSLLHPPKPTAKGDAAGPRSVARSTLAYDASHRRHMKEPQATMTHYDRHVSIASSSRPPWTSRTPCFLATLLSCYRPIRPRMGFSFSYQLSGSGILHLRRRTAAPWMGLWGWMFSSAFCEIPVSHVNIRLDPVRAAATRCGL